MPSGAPRPVRFRRGFILAAVFFIMVVIILLVASLFRLVPQELRWTNDHRRDTLAYYAASGGVKHALAWLRQCRLGGGQSEPFLRTVATDPYQRFSVSDPGGWPYRLLPAADLQPDKPDTYFPAGMPALRNKPGRIRLGADWSADVFLFPDKRTFPHPALNGGSGTAPPCYTILSLAYRDSNANGVCDTGGGENYVLRVETAAVERTFAHYAYFVDQWPDLGSTNTTVWNLTPGMNVSLFSGPVHSNGTPLLRISDSSYWSETRRPAAFGAELSFSGDDKGAGSYDGVAYQRGNYQGDNTDYRPYAGDPPSALDQRYKRLYPQGQASLRRTQRIEFPKNWAEVVNAAWGTQDGREVSDPGEARADWVFVNKLDLGVAVTGGLQELRLDLVDRNGRSQVFDGLGAVRGARIAPPPKGNPSLHMVQEQPVTYIDGYQETYMETGIYTATEFSETPEPGFSPSTYEITTYGPETERVPYYTKVVSSVIPDPPGGPGPASGGSVTHYTNETHWSEVPVRHIEETVGYVRTNETTGLYPATREVDSPGPDRSPIMKNYYPQDAVVSAKDEQVVLPVNYFLDRLPPASDFPVIVGESANLEVTIPAGSTAILRQDRDDGKTFKVSLIPGEAQGAVAVYGDIRSLKGINRGSRTILATSPIPNRQEPKQLANITLDDQILQYGLLESQLPRNGDNGLGILAGNITMSSAPSLIERYRDRKLYLYAALMAADGMFELQRPVDPTTRSAGLTIIGGVMQKEAGRLQIGSQGWTSNYIYDRYLSLLPPPAFPSDGRFDITFVRVSRP